MTVIKYIFVAAYVVFVLYVGLKSRKDTAVTFKIVFHHHFTQAEKSPASLSLK